MRVIIPGPSRALIAKYDLKGWLDENLPVQAKFDKGIESDKDLLRGLLHGEEPDRAHLVASIAQSMSFCISLCDWIIGHDLVEPPNGDNEWYAVYEAAGWLVFQNHERELNKTVEEEGTDG